MEPVVELISPIYREVEVCGDSPHWTWGGHNSCLRVWVEVGVLRGTAFWSRCSGSCKFHACRLVYNYPLIFHKIGLPWDKPYSFFVLLYVLCLYLCLYFLPTLCLCQMISPFFPWYSLWPFISPLLCTWSYKNCSVYNSCFYPCILH